MGKPKEFIDMSSKLATIGLLVLGWAGYENSIKPAAEVYFSKYKIKELQDKQTELQHDISDKTKSIKELLFKRRTLKDNILEKEKTIAQLHNNYKLKIEEIDQLILKEGELENKLLQVEWRLFKGHMYNEFLSPEKSAMNDLPAIFDRTDLSPQVIGRDEINELTMKSNAPYLILKQYIHTLNYDDGIGVTKDKFEFFKKYLDSAVELNKQVLLINETDLITRIDSYNKKVTIISKENKSLSLKEQRSLLELRTEHLMNLSIRKVSVNARINHFLNRLSENISLVF